MRKVALVARREYMEHVRTKGFWIGVLAFPLILALSVVVPVLLSGTKQARTYAVIDHSGFVLEEVEKGILAEDLGIVLRDAAVRYRDGGQAWERLPDAVRAAAKVYVSLAEAERSALVQNLAAGGDEVAAGLVEWWQQVSAEELEGLDLELSRSRYVRVEVPSGDDPPAALNRMVNDGALFAYFVISPDPVASDEGCKYISLNLTDQDLRRWFADRVFQVVRARRIEQAGLDAETSNWLQSSVHFAERKVDKRGDEAEVWAVVPFVYLLWMAIFINAQTLMTNTVEEKSSRLIEVLLSALSPFELMAGKIAGTAAVGLTLVFTWVACVVVGVVVAPAALGDDVASIVGIASTPLYLWSFVFYFLAGFLLYACLLVGAGSLCNSLKDAQSLMLPLLVPLIVPLLTMIPIWRG
ncbi:MAG: ABC transporter permease [Candidatus Latescibacteria bacterium]|nr:ABC transporter permease [Candidatus Latescibacterota bacterium]